MTRWEYATIDEDNCNLTDMGLAGWELVTAVRYSFENERKGYTESGVILYFKRPLAEEPNRATR